MNYRIKFYIDGKGKAYYHPQYRVWWLPFWITFTSNYHYNAGDKIEFEEYDEANNFILRKIDTIEENSRKSVGILSVKYKEKQ